MLKELYKYKQSNSNKKIFFISAIPLTIIMIGEAFKTFFFTQLAYVPNNITYVRWWILAQLILTPTIGILSDKYCRKKMLIITLFFLIFSAILLKTGNTLTALILYSFGAVLPVARAAYCDVHITNRRVPNIINTFIVQPIPWIFFYKLSFFSPRNFFGANLYFLLVFSAGLLLVVSLFWFNDLRDKDHKKLNFKFQGLGKKYGWHLCMRVIFAFFLSNSLWNLLQYYLEHKESLNVCKNYFSIGPGVAYLAGALIARFSDIDKKKMVGLVFLFIAIFSGLLFLQGKVDSNSNILCPIFISITFFGGMGIPSIYTFFGAKVGLHQQGVVYGLLDSLQIATEWTGAFVLFHMDNLLTASSIVFLSLVINFLSVLLTIDLIRTNWMKKRS